MRLLITTQALDLDDPVLSAYHGWVAALARCATWVEVICLKEGRHELPPNVSVYSLGKERGPVSRAAYAARLIALAWRLRDEYDTVFVHMNQEYILAAGWLWKLLGKRIYMWRNHYAGSVLTDIAAAFCTHTFSTSTHSYTAKYKKNLIMPVGVDLARFAQPFATARVPHSLLFFSRIAPSKRAEMFIDALITLKGKGTAFTATICGSALPEDEAYLASLKALTEREQLPVTWKAGIPNAEAPALYAAHDIYVNSSPSGMLDKILFEAAASGCLVIAASDDWNRRTGEEPADSAPVLADRIAALLALPAAEAVQLRTRYAGIAEKEGLDSLAILLVAKMDA